MDRKKYNEIMDTLEHVELNFASILEENFLSQSFLFGDSSVKKQIILGTLRSLMHCSLATVIEDVDSLKQFRSYEREHSSELIEIEREQTRDILNGAKYISNVVRKGCNAKRKIRENHEDKDEIITVK